MRFYIPPNLQSDFSSSIRDLGIDCILNFSLTNKVRIRMDKVNYKTKNGVVSGDEVIFAELSSNLKIGDYIQFKEEILLINQVKTNQFPQCYEISASACNTKFDITRYYAEEYNSSGVITKAAGNYPVVSSLYCITTMGSFEFDTSTGSVGIIPSDVISCSCQVNTLTKTIIEGDKFLWFNDSYMVTSLDYSSVDLDGLDGILTIHAKKVI
ncbi:hypothetical protein [Clostridium sp.]|uniref:hypothetical protein n=1 Tax=Clostridium sp. TaxID=1506 RepID=UPI001A44AF5C|nr:hypothetical protein [Clostridium sp.]MBK5239815.1 hypothetical protein [Clostridium sp.]